MPAKQQVEVAGIANMFLAGEQIAITRAEARRVVDQVFEQAANANQVLDEGLARAYVP